MHSDSELKCLADTGSFYTLTYAAPESRVEQDHITRSIENIGGELFEIYDDGVRRERHPHFLTRSPHAVQAEHGILEIVVVDVLDLLAEPDRLLSRPRRVRIKSE